MRDFLTAEDLRNTKFIKEISVEFQREVNGRCLIDEPFARHTSFRVGGPAKFHLYPVSAKDLGIALQICRERKLETFILGYGTNLLVSDDGFPGCVIDLKEGWDKLEINGNRMISGAGIWLSDAVKRSAENGLSGMEKLAGIPGSLGGGMIMNCGAFRHSISDHLVEVKYMSLDGDSGKATKNEIGFEYRKSPGLTGKIVLEAEFELEKCNRKDAEKEVEETIMERFRRNVMTLPSAGSVFKNPTNGFAAKLIESVGGKGMREGGVEVSKHHANFIVNARSGNAGDIARLITKIRRLVQQRHGIRLELEVKTLGFEAGIEID